MQRTAPHRLAIARRLLLGAGIALTTLACDNSTTPPPQPPPSADPNAPPVDPATGAALPSTPTPSSTAPAPSDPATSDPAPATAQPTLSGYTRAQLLEQAEALGVALEIPVSKRDAYTARLRRVLDENKELGARVDDGRITGVAAFKLGEGGLVVKIIHGEGIAALVGAPPLRFKISAWALGANVGGSAAYGVILIDGLTDPAVFGGAYEGSGTRATAADHSVDDVLSMPRAEVVDRRQAHTLHFVSTSVGLSANAGFKKLEIEPIR